MEEEEYCLDCSRHRHHFDEGRALLLYEGEVRESIHRIKYRERKEYLYTYAKRMAEVMGTWIERKEVEQILFVPMRKRAKRKRGYNQAEVLARALGEELAIGVSDALSKVRSTGEQKYLNPQQRRQNLKNAFAVREEWLDEDGRLPWESVLLVDDVYTTGATLDAVSAVLRKYGVSRIYFATICIGHGLS